MFTGLVDSIGTVVAVEDRAEGRTLTVGCAYPDLRTGESVACNGACLTVVEHGSGWFRVSAIATTRDRTTTGEWQAGTRLNLERAMLVGDRYAGHIVQGHVDGVGTVRATVAQGDAWLVDIEVPPDVEELLVPHGSITVDGVSLTVNALPAPGVLQVSLIDHTMRHTTLGERVPGDGVHLESDIVGKYVRQLVRPRPAHGGD